MDAYGTLKFIFISFQDPHIVDERLIKYTIPKTSQQIPLRLIDFPGQEEYSAMKDQYYRTSNTSEFL